MATHSSVLAWRIHGTEEPGGCRLWGHTESNTTEATQQQHTEVEGNLGIYCQKFTCEDSGSLLGLSP